jgi:hypothetical protein
MTRALLVALVALMGATGCSDDNTLVGPSSLPDPVPVRRASAPFRNQLVFVPDRPQTCAPFARPFLVGRSFATRSVVGFGTGSAVVGFGTGATVGNYGPGPAVANFGTVPTGVDFATSGVCF